MATEKRVRENLVLICKRLSPEAFLMGVANVLNPTDVAVLRKKIERGFSTDGMLVDEILDCLKRRPRWVETLVAFLRENEEIEILHKLGEQIPEENILHSTHSAAPAFTEPRGPGHPQQQPLLSPSCPRDVTKPRGVFWRGNHSDAPISGYAGTTSYSNYGFVQGNADFETQNYQYQIKEDTPVNEHKTAQSKEFDVTLQDVVNNMRLRKSQTYPGLVSRQASYVTPQQSRCHHSVSYEELGFTAENLSPTEENKYGKAHEREVNGYTMNYDMIGLNLGFTGQDTTSTVQQPVYQPQQPVYQPQQPVYQPQQPVYQPQQPIYQPQLQPITCRDQQSILVEIQRGQNNVLCSESKIVNFSRWPGFYTSSNTDHEPFRQSLKRNRRAGEGSNNDVSKHSMTRPYTSQQQQLGLGHVADADNPDQDNSRLPPSQSAQPNDIPATPCPISLSNFQSITTGPGRPRGINDLSEEVSNSDNRNNSFQFQPVPVDVEDETAPLLRPGHRNVVEDLSPGNVTEELSLGNVTEDLLPGNVTEDLSQGNVTEDLSLRHFRREEGDIPGPVGSQLSTLGPSLQVDSESSGDFFPHGAGSAYGAHRLPRCPLSETACGRNPPEHNNSGEAWEALPSPLQNEATSDFPTSAKSHNRDLEIDQPGEVSMGGSGARKNRSREDLASTTSNRLCAGILTAEPNNGEGNSPYREAAVFPCRSEPSVTSSPAAHDASSSSCPPPSPSREYHRQPSTPVNIYIKHLIMNNDSSFNLASDVIANTVLGNNAPESQRSATSCPERHPDDKCDQRRLERELTSSSQQEDFVLQDHQQWHQTPVKCPVSDVGQQDVLAEVSQSTQGRAPPTDRAPRETTLGNHADPHPGARRGPVAPLLMPPHPPNPGLPLLPGDDTRPRAADQTSEAEQLLQQHREVLNTQLLHQHLHLGEMSGLSGCELRLADQASQHVDTAYLRWEENTLLKVPQDHCAAESACQGCEGKTIEGRGHQCQGIKDDDLLSQGRWDSSSARLSPDTQNNTGGEQCTTTAAMHTPRHPDLRLEKCPAGSECRQPLPASHQDTRPTPGADLALPRARPASDGQTGVVQMDPCCRHSNASGASTAQHPETLSGLERGPTVPSPCHRSKASGRESDSGVGGGRAEGGENVLSIPGHLRLANVPPHSFHLHDLKSLQCLSQSLEFHPDILLRLHDEATKADIAGQTGHAEANMIGELQDQTNIFQPMQMELTEANIPKLTMLLA